MGGQTQGELATVLGGFSRKAFSGTVLYSHIFLYFSPNYTEANQEIPSFLWVNCFYTNANHSNSGLKTAALIKQ